MSTSTPIRSARALGVWACGDRRTVSSTRYERARADGTVAVVSIAATSTLSPSKGFLKFKSEGGRLEYMPRVVAIELALPLGGARVYYDVSQSFTDPGSVLPITGQQLDVFKLAPVLAQLKRQGYQKTSTVKVVGGAWTTEQHIPLDATPLGQLQPGTRSY